MPADGLFLLAELHDNLFEVMGTRPIITAVLVWAMQLLDYLAQYGSLQGELITAMSQIALHLHDPDTGRPHH